MLKVIYAARFARQGLFRLQTRRGIGAHDRQDALPLLLQKLRREVATSINCVALTSSISGDVLGALDIPAHPDMESASPPSWARRLIHGKLRDVGKGMVLIGIVSGQLSVVSWSIGVR